MSDRNELALVLANAQRVRNGSSRLPSADQCSRLAFDDADAILDAGYRKPRTITMAEELDALAEGSVILSNGGEDSAQKDGEGYWYLWGGDIGLCPEEVALPAIVLHDPDLLP